MADSSSTVPGSVCEQSGTRVHVMSPDGTCEYCHKDLALVAINDIPKPTDWRPFTAKQLAARRGEPGALKALIAEVEEDLGLPPGSLRPLDQPE